MTSSGSGAPLVESRQEMAYFQALLSVLRLAHRGLAGDFRPRFLTWLGACLRRILAFPVEAPKASAAAASPPWERRAGERPLRELWADHERADLRRFAASAAEAVSIGVNASAASAHMWGALLDMGSELPAMHVAEAESFGVRAFTARVHM